MSEAEYVLDIYKDKAGKYRWRFYCANNGKIMAISSQGYVKEKSAIDCASAILSTNWSKCLPK